ncbi:MAG: zf-HC2 domain-containing protein [Bacteroidetes bacterium]|nr:zf-HC2 domain-containing protein [Bacteroidota bacterium]
MLTCSDAIEQITLALDGRLSSRDLEVLRSHLAVCPDCNQEFESEKAVKALLKTRCKSVDMPPEVSNRLHSLLHDKSRLETLCAGLKEDSPDQRYQGSLTDSSRNQFLIGLAGMILFALAVYLLMLS